MKDERVEENRAGVSPGTKQAGEVRDRWSWTEPCVWTERMLAALENGVKGGKWFSLIDKVRRLDVLYKAWEKVKENQGSAGVDGQTVKQFEEEKEFNLEWISRQLAKGEYAPQPVKRVWIPKPGSREQRPLGVPSVRDRVVQTALRFVLEPIFEKEFVESSYGFRPGRGCKDALRQVDRALKEGCRWVVDADLKSYFDTIPHDRLMERIRENVSDGSVLELIRSYLTQGIMDGLKGWTAEKGTPQGAVISPLLANVYLHPLDERMERMGFRMVRYADDFVILCRSQEDAERVLVEIRNWTESNGLELHPEKTRLVDLNQPDGGFEFLGYYFKLGNRWPRKKSLTKFKDAIRKKTKRTNGNSLEAIVFDVNRTLKGWFEYFKHSNKYTFDSLDKWIRMRLRSILRRRHGRRGRGRGYDNNRWPNAYFAAQGLFSLSVAHAAACQSLRKANH